MKLPHLFTTLVLAIAVASLVVTNPSLDEYARYATRQASAYLSDQVCTEIPAQFGGGLLTEQCAGAVQRLLPELENLLRDRTERLNLGVASLYRTTFGIPDLPLLPEYRFETIGIAKRFITYRMSRTA